MEEKKWDLELECKPDFMKSMDRIYAWYQGEIIDRPPVRFFAHNSFIDPILTERKWESVRDKWFDAEFQIEHYISNMQSTSFLGETFPIYWPNLGPNVYAAFYGYDLIYDECTSWIEPCKDGWEAINATGFDVQNVYFRKLEELTRHALQRCEGKFMVGYSDFHPGMDCVAAWRGTQLLCMDLYEDPDWIIPTVKKAEENFHLVFDHFDNMLKERKQLSSTWLGIPGYGKMHVPSCDFSAMISGDHFRRFCLPAILEEIKPMTHNIFHLDGPGCARHLDDVLGIDAIRAIQWVQGDGHKSIMQWIPLIKRIQTAGKSVVVDMSLNELEGFMGETDPKGLFVCLPASDKDTQEAVLKTVEKWRR